jgi:arginyl-tRNA synthetase
MPHHAIPFTSFVSAALAAATHRNLSRSKRMADHITDAISKLDTMISTAANDATTTTTTTTPNGSVANGRIINLRDELTRLFATAISEAFPFVDVAPEVAICNNPKFGDYQCNNAMALFGRMKGKEGAPANPRATAETILKHLPPSSMIAETSLAGPGFINIRIDNGFLASHVTRMVAAGPEGIKLWAPPSQAGKRVVVDFSSPNVAKEMHVGHLRSTIIGDTIARCFEYCGADVLRLNHIGDWGTQFGMLIQYMAEKREGGLEATSEEDVADLQVLYRAAKARFDEEEDFKTRAREAVTRLQGGDPQCLAAWNRICDASRREFQKIYDRLGVQLQERGESFYNPRLKDTVDELMDQGVAELSDGAKCVFVEGQEIPLIVQKSDGGFGYASTDMAALKQRIHEENADWIIYVTDVGQAQHFQLVFKAAEKAGYLPRDKNVRIDHVGFGLVLGEDGKKFRSRSGDVSIVLGRYTNSQKYQFCLFTNIHTGIIEFFNGRSRGNSHATVAFTCLSVALR